MEDIGNTTFYEIINHVKLNYILQNRKDFEEIIDKDRDFDNDKKANIWAIMKKMYKSVEKIPYSEYGYIKVSYNKGKTCNRIGRWYAKDAIGLAPIKSCIRHTICDDKWCDVDQVNSHPCLLKQIIDKYQYSSNILNKYINNRDDVLNDIMKEENITKDDAKDAVISVINGKKFKSNTLMQLHNEIKLPVEKIMMCDDYKHILDFCKNTFGIKCNLWGKVMSRILQVEENKMLECYIDYCDQKGLIPKYKDGYIVSLVFDGFQLIMNDNINVYLLEELRLYAKEKTGFDVKLKLKPFDKALNIPNDYNLVDYKADDDDEDEYIDPAIKSYEDTKIDFEINKCKIMFPPCIYTTFNNDIDQLQNFKTARDTYGDIVCYVMEKDKKKIKKFINIWLDDPNKKIYSKIDWKPPPLICADDVFNTWKPFDITNVECVESDHNYYNEFLDFCYNLFESKEVADYVISRYAFRLQNAGLRSNVCCVYYGEEGTGKSTFIDTIYKLFGSCAIQIDKAKKLYDNHASFEKEKCFICVNEAGGSDNFENSEVLKTRITEDKLHINPKNIQSYEINNYCDYDMTTNNINVVKITDNSVRRWFQTTTTNYYLGNIEFFNYYRKNILNNKNALRQIYDGLMSYDWNDVVKSGNFQDADYKPETDIIKIVKECNRDKLIWFFKYVVSDWVENDEAENIKVYNSDLFRLWNGWCTSNKVNSYDMNAIQFGIKARQLNNKVKAKTGEDFIIKDTNGKNTIDKPIFLRYFNYLDA